MSKKYHKPKSKAWVWIGGIAAIMLLGLIINGARNHEPEASGAYLTPATGINDVHGLAVDAVDSNVVWIASHTGLFQIQKDKELFVVGDGRDDYMGFSIHPTDPKTLYSSGHPSTGGNIGFQKSTDGARTWQHVSGGVNGPVDFHALAVSQVDPNIVYGWYRARLQRSVDGGQTWRVIDSSLNTSQVIGLVTDGREKDTVYATTTKGLLVSRDQGANWSKLGEKIGDEVVTAMAVSPADNQELLVFAQGSGLVKSMDGGSIWSKIETPLADQMVMGLSYDKHNPKVVYAVNQGLALYKSIDGAATWTKIRDLEAN